MRNWKTESVMLLLTVTFAAFTGGFFAGRNTLASGGEMVVATTRQPQTVLAEPAVRPAAPISAPTEPPAPEGPIALNHATKEQLMTLPGIGETLATRIVEYRENFGAFENVEELAEVSGIGQHKLDAIRELITVG